jgi:hypothetical protein
MLADFPASYTGHPLFAEAMRCVGRPRPRWLCGPMWEDQMGVVVVALLERGHGNREARASAALRQERARLRTIQEREWYLSPFRIGESSRDEEEG